MLRLFLIALITLIAGCGGGGDDGLPVTMSLSATATGPTSATLAWSAESVTYYSVYMNGESLGTTYPPQTSVKLTTLTPDTRYCFRVYAVVFPLGTVGQSNEACITTPPTVKPSVPTDLTATVVSPGQIDLAWAASTGDFSGYRIYRDESYVAATAATSYADTTARPSTEYCYAISAYDAWGYESPKTPPVCATTPVDTEKPSIPTEVKALYDPLSAANPTIRVTWQPAYDNSGTIAIYNVYRDGAFRAQVTDLEYTDSGLAASTQYCYTITALDYANNESAPGGPSCATTSWTSAMVDGTVSTRWTAIDIDADDEVHIAYYDNMWTGSGQQAGTVKYATNASGVWQTTAIDSVAPYVGASIDLLANDDGSLNVAYYDATYYLLKLATRTTNIWMVETIASNLLNVITVGMDRDAAGKLHLVVNPSGKVTYMNNTTGTWVSEVIGDNNVIFGNAATCAIAVDAVGKAHVAYYDYTSGTLKYVTNQAGGWITQTIDTVADAGMYTTIALDSDGQVHLAYYDWTNGDLRYASNASGGWVTQTLDSTGDVGRDTAIAVDAAGHVHVSYIDVTYHALKYATNDKGAWTTYVIDDYSYVGDPYSDGGGYTSIAVDSAGAVHISYRGDARLRYATNR
jgi:hypothetical protein